MSTETEKIKAEMKLLHWHKLANDAALKAALLKTKTMKAKDAKRPVGVENVKAKAGWMQRVIEEEQAKPLQVTKDFVLEYQENERREEERLDAEVARHIECLRKLRVQIEKRESLRERKAAYKAARKQMVGKSGVPPANVGVRPKPPDHDAPPPVGPFPPQPTGTLTTVLSSLDRLVDLERRICSLEKDSIYDRVEAAAKGGMRQRGPLTFTKQRLPPRSNRPAQDVWAVKLQPPKPDRLSKSRKPSRRDASMNSWLNRKQARDQQKRQTVARAGRPLVRGAAGGRRGRNNAEQAFLDQKRSNQRRTDALRGLGTRRGNAKTFGVSRRPMATTSRRRPLAQTTGSTRRGGSRMPSIGANRTGPRMGGSRMNGGSSRMRSVPAARSYASGPRPGGRFGASGGRGTMPRVAGSGLGAVRGRRAWG